MIFLNVSQTLQTLGWFFEMSKVQKCKCQNCEGFGENTWRRSVINWTARSCELQIQLKVFVMWVVANLANYILCTFPTNDKESRGVMTYILRDHFYQNSLRIGKRQIQYFWKTWVFNQTCLAETSLCLFHCYL